MKVRTIMAALLASAILPASAPDAAAGDALQIASYGRSSYVIMTPDKPAPVVSYAAKELQRFLRDISGVRLEIVRESRAAGRPAFIIGECRRPNPFPAAARLAAMREDGVLIKTVGEDVVLRGSNERGQLYSVYVLLEKFMGVRFLAGDCTIVPKNRRLTLPEIDYAYAPPFMYRETLYWDSFPRKIATRQRLNGPYSKCDAEVGGKIQIQPYVHSFAQLVPPDKYFAEHPEYFSLVGGKRTNLTVHGQLCLSNPDVLKIATAQVLKWIEEHPEIPIFDVSQNDGNGPCECDKCMAIVNEEGSQHGPILRFVNAIAEVVEQKHPDKWIETLAYAYSTRPPSITKPRKNVMIRLCHAGCFFHGFEKCGLGANLAQYLDAWSKETQTIFIWHYATNFAHYIAPCQNLDSLVSDIRYYASHNVRGLMVQCNYQSPGGELAEIRQYLAARLMWDPSLDPAVLRQEFCKGYYGAAAADVLSYLELLDRAAERPDSHAFAAWDPKATVPDTLVADALKILGEARARRLTKAQAGRVDRIFLPLWYMQLTYPETYGLTAEKAPALVKEFRRVVESSKVTHINEGRDIASWLTEMDSKFAPKG